MTLSPRIFSYFAIALLALGFIQPAAAQTATSRTVAEQVADGDHLLYESRYDEAHDLYSILIDEVGPTTPQAALPLAHRCWLYTYLLFLDEALTDCKAAANLDAELADAQIYLIRVYNWRGESDLAFTAANRALELAPNDPLALGLLAEAYFDAANIEQAFTTIDQAIAAVTTADPAYSAIYRNLAIFHQQDQPERYEEEMAKAIALAPAFAPLYDEFSSYYQERANFGPLLEQLQALTDIFTAAQDVDRQIEYLTLLADYTFLIGDYVNSLTHYQLLFTLTQEQGLSDQAARSLGRVGLIQLWLGDLEHAQPNVEQALSMEVADASIRAELLLNMARIYRQQGKVNDAEMVLQNALNLFGTIDDPVNHLTVLNELGNISLDRGQSKNAINYHTEALSIAREADFSQGIVITLSYLAVAYTIQGAYPIAESTFLDALQMAQALKLPNDEATVRIGLARVYRLLGRFNEASAQLEAADGLLQTIDNLALHASVLAELGLVRTSQARFTEAEQLTRDAIDLYQSLGDRSGQASALTNLGLVQFNRAEFESARANYLTALDLIRDDAAASLKISILNNLGAVADSLGSLNDALSNYEDALAQSRTTGNQPGESAALGNIAVVYHKQGRFQEALSTNQEALAIAEATGNPVAQAAMLANIGQVYRELGENDLAEEFYQRGLTLQQSAGDRGGEANTLISIAEMKQIGGATESALATYQETLAIHRELGLVSNEVTILNNIGMIYYVGEDMERAATYFNDAIEIARAIGDQNQEAVLLENLAGIDIRLSNPDAALVKLQQSLTINTELGNLTGMASAQTTMAWAFEVKQDITQAISHYQAAVALRESQMREISVGELKASFASLQVDEYARLAILLLSETRIDEAFDTIERARARVLLDQLASGAVDFRDEINATLLDQEQTLRKTISARRAQLLSLRNRPRAEWDAATIQTAQTNLSQLESNYSQLVTQIKVQSPEATSLVTVDVATLEEVQQLLPPQTTLVEYFLTSSENVALVITAESVKVVEIPATQTEIADAISDFRDFVTLDDPHPASLQTLYGWLIVPIADLITTPNVAIVPHGVLHYLPFAALTDGEHYFGERYATYTLPSASVLRYLRPKDEGANPTLLALGNPATDAPLAELPFAAKEAESVAELYASTARIGTDATESIVREQASQSTILHLAAHGELNAASPLFSTLYLAPDDNNDGRLEVHEIYGLDLTSRTDLVVLSACQTSLGDLSAGDEVVGLNRAFLFAGTPSVVASLWNVDDAATAQLMTAFYGHLRAGMGKAEALGAAQSDVRATYPHPYYWASFVLTGDGGAATQLAAQMALSDAITNTASDLATPVAPDAPAATTNDAPLPWGMIALVIIALVATGYMFFRRRTPPNEP